MTHPADPTDLNVSFWREEASAADYEYETLSAAEHQLLTQYRQALSGRVLELGPGAGRVTRHLVEHASALTALEVSPVMAEACRRNVPRAVIEVRDMRALDDFAADSFDAVVASNNVLDVLSDDERRVLLGELARIVGPTGVLLFSTHNRDGRVRRPWQPRDWHWPAGVAEDVRHFPRNLRTHRRLKPLEREEPDYALRNDEAHGFSLIHYNISAALQARQLADAGFTLELCMTDAAHRVDVAGPPSGEPYLHYGARRAPIA